MNPRLVLAVLGLAVQVAQAAEPIALRVTNGLPVLSQVDGQAVAWRYLTVRADASFVRLEARLSDCIGAQRVVPGGSPAGRSSGCGGVEGDRTSERRSQQLQARFRVPPLVDGAPQLEAALRNWRTFSGGATSSTSKGSSVDVELTQPIGPAKAFAGYTVPIGRVTPGDDWRTSYTGVRWAPLPRHSVALSADWSRQAGRAARERESTVEYSYARGQSTRWRMFVTRAIDVPADPWRSGLGLDWTF